MERAQEFGVVALRLGYATIRQIEAARGEQDRRRRHEGTRPFLAEILLEQRVLSGTQLLVVLEQAGGYRDAGLEEDAADLTFGEIAIRKRYVTSFRVYRALREQRDEDARGLPHRPLGEILAEHGWLAPWELEDVLLALAEAAFGSTRTGETPSEAIPLPREHDRRRRADQGSRTAIAPPRLAPTVPRTARDVMEAPVVASWGTLLGDALELAFERDAEVLVIRDHEVVGTALVGDVCQEPPRTPIARIPAEPVVSVSESTPVAEVVDLLAQSGLACVGVRSRGEIVGVVTRRSLRRSGVHDPALAPVPFADEELGGSG